MYGWVFGALESTVLNRWGTEKWKEILDMAECPIKSGDFINNVHYTDELFLTVMACTEKVLNMEKEKIIEDLGENFLFFIRDNGYDSTMRAQGTTFGEFLENMNEPHRLLRSRFPESYLPEFWCTKSEQNTNGHLNEYTCTLHYYSQRGTLFCPMVVGMVKEIGRQLYNVNCSLEMQSQFLEENYVHTIWQVTYVGVPQSEQIAVPPPEQKPLHSSVFTAPNRIPMKCPWTGSDAGNHTIPSTISKERSTSEEEAVIDLQGRKPSFKPVGLSFQRLTHLFPFHLILNQDLEIIQFGEKIQNFLNLDVSDEIFMDELFTFQTPPNFGWSWANILELKDSCVELVTVRGDTRICFRGNVIILDPESGDPGIDEPCALLLLSPVVYNLEELENLNMKLSDFPVHSFQRDLMVLGEHLKVEQTAAVRLDVLSKKLEEESKKSLNSLKTKRAFVRYVSHEIRSPLGIALLGLKYIQDHLKDQEQAHIVEETLTDVQNSCTVAVDVLNDFLLYEKFDDGIFAMTKNEIRIADYFMEAVNVYKIQARNSNITFNISTQDIDDVIVNLDVMKFSQVLRNLLSNALKFTPKGGTVNAACFTIPFDQSDSDQNFNFAEIPPAVKEQFDSLVKLKDFGTTRLSQTVTSNSEINGYVRVSVQDTGAGMTPDNQKLLFHQFIQINADKLQGGQGSGLGLWIASSIMHLHGGRIGVYSAGEGKGSTFVIDVPIYRREKYMKSKSYGTMPLRPKLDYELIAEKIKPLRLLIVDDSAMNRKIVKRVLEGKFDLIDEAENGSEAVKMNQIAYDAQQPYNIIMMDSHMPVMNGLDAARMIKKTFPEIKIVGVTGNALKSDIENFLEAGADKIMVKPLNLEEFFNFIVESNF